MRTCNFRIMLLIVIMAAVAVGNSPVSADPCSVQSSSVAYTAPYYYNQYASGVMVPVSATCSFVGGTLFAVGTAIDTSTNANVGVANTVLSAPSGTNIYTGQLIFSLSPGVPETLRISISIYSGLYIASYSSASPLTTGVQTVKVNSNNYQQRYASCYYNSNCNQISNSCTFPSNNSTTQCVGYLYQNTNGCVELVIPIYSAIGLLSYQYYTLQKLPASYPAIGTWVTVIGELNQGYNFASNGSGCPGNYINVTSIS